MRRLLVVFHFHERPVVLAGGLNRAGDDAVEGVAQFGEFNEKGLHHRHAFLEGLATIGNACRLEFNNQVKLLIDRGWE
jgi:hypothetical protein